MSLEEWHLRCIKDYLISFKEMPANDNYDIVLNHSDSTFKIKVTDDRARATSSLKGEFELEEDYINLKFKNAVWKVKI